MVSAPASGAGGREFKSGSALNNLVRAPHRNFLKVLIPHRAVIVIIARCNPLLPDGLLFTHGKYAIMHAKLDDNDN